MICLYCVWLFFLLFFYPATCPMEDLKTPWSSGTLNEEDLYWFRISLQLWKNWRGCDRRCSQKPGTSCFKNSSSPLERGKTRDYNKIKGRSFCTSFDTVGRVGCAETRASGEAQESGEVGKAGTYKEVTVSFRPGLQRAACPQLAAGNLPCWQAPFATLVAVTLIFPHVPWSQLRAEPMCSVHVMQSLVTRANWNIVFNGTFFGFFFPLPVFHIWSLALVPLLRPWLYLLSSVSVLYLRDSAWPNERIIKL